MADNFYKASVATFSFGEKKLQLLIPDASTVFNAYSEGGISFPYWSQVWPSSIALSQFLSQNTSLVNQKEVLELGAGLGLPSMVAACYAKRVISSDHNLQAVELIKRSAQLNGLQNLFPKHLDWKHLPQELKTDVLLLSDVNYEQSSFKNVSGVIERFLTAGSIIILATPQRLMAKEFVLPLLRDCIQQEAVEVDENSTNVTISLLILKR